MRDRGISLFVIRRGSLVFLKRIYAIGRRDPAPTYLVGCNSTPVDKPPYLVLFLIGIRQKSFLHLPINDPQQRRT